MPSIASSLPDHTSVQHPSADVLWDSAMVLSQILVLDLVVWKNQQFKGFRSSICWIGSLDLRELDLDLSNQSFQIDIAPHL